MPGSIFTQIQMKNTKIIKLLKTFSKKELKEFESFINSPAQLKRRDVTNTFKVLKPFYPSFDSKDFSVENVYKKLFPGKKFDKSKYSLAVFHLFDTACEYLILLDYNENKIERAFSLMNQFSNRGMNNAFEKMSRKMDEEIMSSKMSLDNFFYYRYRYEDLLMTFYTGRGEYDLRFKSFHNKINLSTGLFLLRFLRGLPNIRVAEEFYKVQLDTGLTNTMLDAIDIDKIFSNPNINPYLKILEVSYFLYKGMTDTNNENWTLRADKTFFKNISLYNQDERSLISILLTNLYSKLIRDAVNREERDRLSGMKHEMTKSLLKYGLFKNKKDPFMPELFFRNIVFTALDIKELDWAENFIKDFKTELKPEYRENLINYCLAMLEFDRNNYDKSFEYLSTVKYESFYYKSDVKLLLMLLYFELKLFEEAYYMLDTTRKFFKTSKEITEQDRIVYSNFVNHYSQLLKLVDKPDNISIEMEIKKIIENKVKIEYSDWLLKKFEDLK